jgi:hypothetical protein
VRTMRSRDVHRVSTIYRQKPITMAGIARAIVKLALWKLKTLLVMYLADCGKDRSSSVTRTPHDFQGSFINRPIAIASSNFSILDVCGRTLTFPRVLAVEPPTVHREDRTEKRIILFFLLPRERQPKNNYIYLACGARELHRGRGILSTSLLIAASTAAIFLPAPALLFCNSTGQPWTCERGAVFPPVSSQL